MLLSIMKLFFFLILALVRRLVILFLFHLFLKFLSSTIPWSLIIILFIPFHYQDLEKL
jgi:hypothetical protein